MPTVEADGIARGIEYFYKEFCLYAANEDISQYHALFNEYSCSEVWDFVAVKKKFNYIPEGK